MTYRERMERRIERRQEWAEKRRDKAAVVFKDAEKYRGDYAFNTQPGHIPERARLIRREDRAFEDLKVAEYHESKASGLERHLDRSIFSDDEDAPERLRERITELEAKRTKMKAENSAYRKGDEAFAAALGITLEQAKARRETIEAGYSWCRQPYPAYELSNLGGNIRRLTERLKTIEIRRERTAKAEEAAGGIIIEAAGTGFEGEEYSRITFAEKPQRAILDALKAAGFMWGGGSWSGKTAAIPECVKAEASNG